MILEENSPEYSIYQDLCEEIKDIFLDNTRFKELQNLECEKKGLVILKDLKK
jgi:hypothetical protein